MIGMVKCFNAERLKAWAKKTVIGVCGNDLTRADITTIGVVIGT